VSYRYSSLWPSTRRRAAKRRLQRGPRPHTRSNWTSCGLVCKPGGVARRFTRRSPPLPHLWHR